MDNDKEKLRNLVNLLPLDKWQLESAEEGIARMPLEEATRVAKDLSYALRELPKVVAKFNKALINHQHLDPVEGVLKKDNNGRNN